MKNKKEYWFCVIGPVQKDKLGWGADGPLRMGVKDKFYDMFNEQEEVCASGWGVSEKKYKALRSVFSCSDEELPDLLENPRWYYVSEFIPPENTELLVKSPDGKVHLTSWRPAHNIFTVQEKTESSEDWKWRKIPK